jgi:diguanylate cyclase (GGDEF)-like protein/PAS domain S-box-containing protein
VTTGQHELAAAWDRALAGSSSVPRTAADDRGLFAQLAEWIIQVPADPDLARKAGAAVANALIDAHYTQSASLSASFALLDEHLADLPDPRILTALRSGLAAGYADALRERTRAEQESIRQAVLSAYRTGEARFRAVFRNSALGIGIADGHGRILEVNQSLADMMGVEPTDVRGMDFRDFKRRADPPAYWEAHERLLAGEESLYTAERQLMRMDGSVIWTQMRSHTVLADDGSVALLIALFEDITARRELHERLKHQAAHDPLTGLPNRRELFERLERLLREAAPDERVGVCFLDLDGFKGVNDTLGHEVGDRLLTEIAHRLGQVTDLRRHTVARMGGDEFVILVPRSDGPQSVIDVAESVLTAVQRPVFIDGNTLTMTASLGLVERPARGAAATELLRAADITLYWAKSDGKGRWALFDPQRNAREVARYSLSHDLPEALERGELFLEYQPIVSLTDGVPREFEALVRWNHPVRGLLGPGQFVPVAEETGAIVALGEWVLRQATADAAHWPPGPDGEPVAVAVNVAVRQVREPRLAEIVAQALAAAKLPGERLRLEITESAIMDPGDGGQPALGMLHELAAQGVGIVIDDFGTGYSNLSYLRRLPADCLKIDSSFVSQLSSADGDASSEAIVTSLITLAHACGMSVIAEGVESNEQARRLAELGADSAQGFLFSRAVPNDRVPELLDTLRRSAQGVLQ